MNSFPDIIRRAREKEGLLLRQVGAALDMDVALISKFERGIRRPSKEQLYKISSFYDLDFEQLSIAWMSDKVVSELINEVNAPQILREAEAKISILKSK